MAKGKPVPASDPMYVEYEVVRPFGDLRKGQRVRLPGGPFTDSLLDQGLIWYAPDKPGA